jgi:FtsP/CotA-like multicopper oxidase with cupredoxin domain
MRCLPPQPFCVCVGLFLLLAGPSPGTKGRMRTDERIFANDNRSAAGSLQRDTLMLQLEVRRGQWFPTTDSGPSQPVLAFAEAGKPLTIPGPLVRVRRGTPIRVVVRNTLSDSTVVIHGLHARPGTVADTVQLRPGAERAVAFNAGAPGSYYYWGGFAGATMEDRHGEDSQLYGALIVDSTDVAPADRVFVIGTWFEEADTTQPKPWIPRDMMVINGKSWPYTERFTFATGDTVRWRWLNPSADAHPMHLHGFYFDVESRGNGVSDSVYIPGARRQAVTELMLPGGTMSMQWVAERPGNWLFHCHFGFHVSHYLSLNTVADPADPDSPAEVGHSASSMAGLVLGITVTGTAMSSLATAQPVRDVRLFMQAEPVQDKGPAHRYAFVEQQGPQPPAPDSVPEATHLLVLRRRQPVAITVVNRMPYPSAVHWHGIELENSDADGVPGWSGSTAHPMAEIMPGDSTTVTFTPPRAGTFIYHSHSNEGFQIAAGLAGPLLVLDEHEQLDSNVDHTILVNQGFDETGRVNGRATPDTLRLAMGRVHRLRLVQIAPDWRVIVSLGDSGGTTTWRAVAKDGADLPARQRSMRPARVLMGPGETADFTFSPQHPGPMTLSVATQLKGWRVDVPVVVAERD